MSFGFSVGDFVAAAQLAHTLFQSLSSSTGSAQEYKELIAELDVVHKVLLHVHQLQASNRLALATTNYLLIVVAATTDAIESFLTQYEVYGSSLRRTGSGNPLRDMWKKGSWALQMPKRVSFPGSVSWLGMGDANMLTQRFQVDRLRCSISTLLASINCLVTLACYYK
jgi:hypothetical protein